MARRTSEEIAALIRADIEAHPGDRAVAHRIAARTGVSASAVQRHLRKNSRPLQRRPRAPAGEARQRVAEYLAAHQEPVSGAELARKLDLPPSTVIKALGEITRQPVAPEPVNGQPVPPLAGRAFEVAGFNRDGQPLIRDPETWQVFEVGRPV